MMNRKKYYNACNGQRCKVGIYLPGYGYGYGTLGIFDLRIKQKKTKKKKRKKKRKLHIGNEPVLVKNLSNNQMRIEKGGLDVASKLTE